MDDSLRNEIRLAERAEADACRDMYDAAPAAIGVRVDTCGDATLLLAPRIPASYFNRVIGLGEGPSPAGKEDIETIRATYAAAGVREWWLHLTPAAAPPALRDWLGARGFMPPPRRYWAKFVRDVEAPPASRTSLAVRRAVAADATAVGEIACAAFGMPPSLGVWFGALVGRPGWEFVVACDGDTPVATGALFVRGTTGWIGIGATLPSHRGRGGQGALLAARLRVAAEAGCTRVVTETGEPVGNERNPSLANIRRAGFRQVCSRENFAAPP